MVESIKLWFRVVYETMQSAVAGLNKLTQRLHNEALRHEDPKDKDMYDPHYAEKLREQAKEYGQTSEDVKRAIKEAVKDQPGDHGEEK